MNATSKASGFAAWRLSAQRATFAPRICLWLVWIKTHGLAIARAPSAVFLPAPVGEAGMEMGVDVLVDLRQFLGGKVVAIACHLRPPGLEGVRIIGVGGGEPIPRPGHAFPRGLASLHALEGGEVHRRLHG